MFPTQGNANLLFTVNKGKVDLIISIISKNQLRITLLMIEIYLFVGLEFLRWLHWLYDYT